MSDLAAPPLQDWRTLCSVIAGAAATLIGAMFVVVSLGIGVLTRDRAASIRTFLSATVGHLAAVLLLAVFALIPGLGWQSLAAAFGAIGLLGLGFGLRNALGFDQHPGTDRSDWYWYALFPLLGYAVLLAAGVLALRRDRIGLDAFAAALLLLLAAAIRNGWDMIVYLVTYTRRSD